MTHLQISMILNIGSLALGTASIVLAVAAIAVSSAKNTYKCSSFSFVLCISSLLFQIFEIYNRVIKGDFSAIEDTIRAVALASVVLVVVTLILNMIALKRAKRKF